MYGHVNVQRLEKAQSLGGLRRLRVRLLGQGTAWRSVKEHAAAVHGRMRGRAAPAPWKCCVRGNCGRVVTHKTR